MKRFATHSLQFALFTWISVNAIFVRPTPDISAGDEYPRAVFATTGFDFGDVYRGEILSYVFVIRNAGTADLVIKEFTATCGCSTADSDRVINLFFYVNATIEIYTAEQAGAILKTAVIKTNDPLVPSLSLSLVANVLTGPGGGPVEGVPLRQGKHVGGLFVSPGTGWVFQASSTGGKFEFTVSAEKGNIKVVGAEADSARLKCAVQTFDNQKTYKIVVDYHPIERAETFDAVIKVRTDNPQLPWFPLHLHIRV